MVSLDPVAVQLALTVLSCGGSAAALGWWLSSRFQSVVDKCGDIVEKHEEIDQRRHDENLQRFNKIEIQLARLGARGNS